MKISFDFKPNLKVLLSISKKRVGRKSARLDEDLRKRAGRQASPSYLSRTRKLWNELPETSKDSSSPMDRKVARPEELKSIHFPFIDLECMVKPKPPRTAPPPGPPKKLQ